MEKGAVIFFSILFGSLIASVIPFAANFPFPLIVMPLTIWLTVFTILMSSVSLSLLKEKPNPDWTLKEFMDFSVAKGYYPIVSFLCWIAVVVLWLSILGVKL
ncbi:MAG: hypothetical protein NWF08_06700 [Candidatus Bathyarchaeota archaeon]|nr:hypothetical protein [Candidatus Bathyarchaeota archaeon]